MIDQNELYIAARDSLNLPNPMRNWDYKQMLVALDKLARKHSTNPRDFHVSIREFSRKHLQMKGERFIEVKSWIREEKMMTFSDVVRVLDALALFSKESGSGDNIDHQNESGVVSALVKYTLTQLVALAQLAKKTGIQPKLVSNVERDRVAVHLKLICDAYGIPVKIELQTQGKPLTVREFAKLSGGDE